MVGLGGRQQLLGAITLRHALCPLGSGGALCTKYRGARCMLGERDRGQLFQGPLHLRGIFIITRHKPMPISSPRVPESTRSFFHHPPPRTHPPLYPRQFSPRRRLPGSSPNQAPNPPTATVDDSRRAPAATPHQDSYLLVSSSTPISLAHPLSVTHYVPSLAGHDVLRLKPQLKARRRSLVRSSHVSTRPA